MKRVVLYWGGTETHTWYYSSLLCKFSTLGYLVAVLSVSWTNTFGRLSADFRLTFGYLPANFRRTLRQLCKNTFG